MTYLSSPISPFVSTGRNTSTMQKVRTLSAVVALSSPLVIGIGAFAPQRQETRAQPNALDATTARRQWLLTFSILAPEAFVGPSPASGLVFFDPDRYGDKELKIAAVNKIRQNVRDVIVAQPELAPQFLQLAIQDGLTYNAKDQRGGPDGSIISAILSKDSPADLAFLKTASEVLVNLKAKLKKSPKSPWPILSPLLALKRLRLRVDLVWWSNLENSTPKLALLPNPIPALTAQAK